MLSPSVSLLGLTSGCSEAQKRKLTVNITEHDNDNCRVTKKRKIFVAKAEKTTFVGSNSENENYTDENKELYVARIDKNTGKLKLYPAELITMFLRKEHVNPELANPAEKSYQDSVDELVMNFGAEKQRKNVVKRREFNMQLGTAEMGFAQVVETAKSKQDQTPCPDTPKTSSAIPPYNMDAVFPADVYKLVDIIGQFESNSLLNFIDELPIAGSNKSTEGYYQSVLCRLSRLAFSEEKRQKECCLLLYLQYMMTMYRMNYSQIRKRDPLPEEWPHPVKKMMLDRFTVMADGRYRCMPATLKDLLLSHILVLLLTMDDFCIHLNDVCKDLNISFTKVQTHARALGCKVKKETLQNESLFKATLRVPLTFPSVSGGRRKNKK